jgi:hypothetical protein
MAQQLTEKIKTKSEGDSRLTSAGGIMKLVNAPGGKETIVRFYREHDLVPEDDINHLEYLEMSRDLWEEFGEPETITTSVVAGDAFNS